jgi:YD repeat-containing protein
VVAPALRGRWDTGGRAGRSLDTERAGSGPAASDDRSRRHVETTKLLLAASQLARTAQQAPTPQTAPLQQATFDTAPAPVREALLRLASGRPLKDLRIQHRLEPVPRFETRFDLDGVEHEMNYDPQGKLLESEVEIGPSEIPATVQQSVNKIYPGAVLMETERMEGVRFPGPTYEIELRAGGVRRELWVNEAGEVVRDRLR